MLGSDELREYENALGSFGARVISDGLEDWLEVTRGCTAQVNQRIRFSSDGVGSDDLGDVLDHRPDVIGTGLAATEQLDECLGGRWLIDRSVVARDHAVVFEPIHPSFDGGGGETHVCSNRRERCACRSL